MACAECLPVCRMPLWLAFSKPAIVTVIHNVEQNLRQRLAQSGLLLARHIGKGNARTHHDVWQSLPGLRKTTCSRAAWDGGWIPYCMYIAYYIAYYIQLCPSIDNAWLILIAFDTKLSRLRKGRRSKRKQKKRNCGNPEQPQGMLGASNTNSNIIRMILSIIYTLLLLGGGQYIGLLLYCLAWGKVTDSEVYCVSTASWSRLAGSILPASMSLSTFGCMYTKMLYYISIYIYISRFSWICYW